MTKERRNEIAYQIEKLNMRRNFSFRDIDNAKREIGNLVIQPEIVEANISKDELLEYGKFIIREVFDRLIAGL